MSRMKAWFYCDSCRHSFAKWFEWEIPPWEGATCPKCGYTFATQTLEETTNVD